MWWCVEFVFFFKQKTAYEMRISDWSSDVCSSDLADIWTVMRHADGPLTSYYLLAALDRRIDTEGHILRVPREQAVFVDIFLRTFKIGRASCRERVCQYV